MIYYSSTGTLNLMQQAFSGSNEARCALMQTQAAHVILDDFSAMILVQKKSATYCNDLIRWLNCAPPSEENQFLFAADIYTCSDSGAAHTSIPIPNSFSCKEVTVENDIWSFVSRDVTISGTISQMNQAMFPVVFSLKGATAKDIERCFFAIPNTVVPQATPRTVADNPPIIDPALGEVVFNEELQYFEIQWIYKSRTIFMHIATSVRDVAIAMLPMVKNAIRQWGEIDSCAKEFAAQQLLTLKNDSWLQDDESIMTSDAFFSKISAQSLSFDDKGLTDIWYTDGDIFGGHGICIQCSPKGIPYKASLHG